MTMTNNLVDGKPCDDDAQCVSTFCTDGVCCGTACKGECTACTAAKKGGGNDGDCGNIPAATDPDDECDGPASLCDGPGFCNGNGACAPPKPANFPCLDGTCVGGTATDPSLCDGGGTCVAPVGTHVCPAGCLDSVICKTPCTLDSECPPTEYCASPNCAPKKPLGSACTGAAQCGVGFCVDGVCCDGACGGGSCAVCVKAKGATADGSCTLLNGPAAAGKCDDGLACTNDTCSGGACANPARVCAEASDACHTAPACVESTGKCSAETPTICPTDNLGVCETRLCDVTAQGACVVRSQLDGAPCVVSGAAGICVAGSCFTITGSTGNGGAGGVMSTASSATSASATTGGGGSGGDGGSGAFHFAGGACTVVNAVNDGETPSEWLLIGLLFAARRRPRRAAITSLRGSRDA
jgi:hypothetical protein